ncbi:hypothetical protein ACOMHN_000773 [Nucella lapillus]
MLFLNPDSTEAQELKSTGKGEEEIIKPAPDADLCKSDESVANLCGACAALPEMASLPVELCCIDGGMMAVCRDCLTDPSACLLDIITVQNMISATVDSDNEADTPDISDAVPMEDVDTPTTSYLPDDAGTPTLETTKRYGTLFLGKRPLHYFPPAAVLSDVSKRDNIDDVMEADSDSDVDADDVEKRWGTLGLGSGNYGRYARFYWTPAYQLQTANRNSGKRWGSLGIGKRWGSLGIGNGNRWSSLGVGKRWGSLGIGNGKRESSLENEKKWGMLGIGKRWGSLGIGNWKRWGSLGLSTRYRGKRWGTLGIGKRANPFLDDNTPDMMDEEKRWGTLGLGNRGPLLRGKRWGSLGLSTWRKRWGLLGLEGKRWGSLGIGKRNEILTALDDNENYLDHLADSYAEDKRWGTLNLGKRGDVLLLGDGLNPEVSEDKRWGTLGIGKRWGSLGGFGGFKRWGYIGFGHKNPYSHRHRHLGKRSTDAVEPTEKSSESESRESGKSKNEDNDNEMTDPWKKKWGSLGIGKKWGSLGIGKKWGSLGIGKKWGTLGLGKKWGSLGISKKQSSSQLATKKEEENGSGEIRWGSLGLSGKRNLETAQ